MPIRNKLFICIGILFVFSAGIMALALFSVMGIYNNSVLSELIKDQTSTGTFQIVSSFLRTSLVFFIAAFAAVFITMMVVMGVIVFLLTKSVFIPLNKLYAMVNEIKDGNLDFQIQYTGRDEFGKVFRAFDEMRKRLKESLHKQIRDEQERKEMVVSIAHDIKTPMTSIYGHIQGVIDGIANTPEKLARYYDVILQKSVVVDRLINDLFLFSKLDIHGHQFTLERVNVEEYIETVFGEFALDHKDLHVEIVFNVDERTQLTTDPFQLSRVFQNIVDNSLRYKNKDIGEVTVTVRENEYDLIIQIADNGIGVCQEDLEHIFSRFYRSDRARSNGGSGLGLSISKQIVLGLNGKIWARSKENEGLSIYISFPRNE